MTKLELIHRLSDAGDKSLEMLNNGSKISKDKLMKFKKVELEQFLKAYEILNNILSKCMVDDRKPSPCNKCSRVSDKVACCGCREYFEWRDQ